MFPWILIFHIMETLKSNKGIISHNSLRDKNTLSLTNNIRKNLLESISHFLSNNLEQDIIKTNRPGFAYVGRSLILQDKSNEGLAQKRRIPTIVQNLQHYLFHIRSNKIP